VADTALTVAFQAAPATPFTGAEAALTPVQLMPAV
jgi:hypothetical protein